jgi:hypothetical protein
MVARLCVAVNLPTVSNDGQWRFGIPSDLWGQSSFTSSGVAVTSRFQAHDLTRCVIYQSAGHVVMDHTNNAISETLQIWAYHLGCARVLAPSSLYSAITTQSSPHGATFRLRPDRGHRHAHGQNSRDGRPRISGAHDPGVIRLGRELSICCTSSTAPPSECPRLPLHPALSLSKLVRHCAVYLGLGLRQSHHLGDRALPTHPSE